MNDTAGIQSVEPAVLPVSLADHVGDENPMSHWSAEFRTNYVAPLDDQRGIQCPPGKLYRAFQEAHRECGAAATLTDADKFAVLLDLCVGDAYHVLQDKLFMARLEANAKHREETETSNREVEEELAKK